MSVETWDNMASLYKEESYWEHPSDNQANLQIILSYIQTIAKPMCNMEIVEMGSGSGLLSRELAHRGINMTLLDYSPFSMGYALDKFKKVGLDCKFYVEDALRSTLPDDHYDMAFNVGVIEHFSNENKKRLIKEMLRVIKPGGKVVILVPNSDCRPFVFAQCLLKITGKWSCGFEDDMNPRRLKEMLDEMQSHSIVYSFNPIGGWLWIPIIRRLVVHLGFDNLSYAMLVHPRGMMTVAIVKKEDNK
jgi:2-polyprenyl-3-methyl-5-hydroxy-6-metoxy-1,4-benzoquinol methylase